MSLSFLKSKKFLITLAVCIVVLGPSSYAGASYYQSNKLVKEGDKLADSGDYTGAVSKYDQAIKKWKWSDKKISPKKAIAQTNATSNENLTQMTANFGKGEWQKCLDYLANIDKDFPQYSQAQNRYSDCQKKLDEETATATAKKAEDDRLAAEAAAKIAADAKAKATSSKTATVATTATKPVSDAIFEEISRYCKIYPNENYCKVDCANNNTTCKTWVDKTFHNIDINHTSLCSGTIKSELQDYCTTCNVHDAKCLSMSWGGA